MNTALYRIQTAEKLVSCFDKAQHERKNQSVIFKNQPVRPEFRRKGERVFQMV
jgi:hypothetical protein